MTVTLLVTTALLVLNLAILPFFVFLLAVALAALVARSPRALASDPRSRFLIVIPAHNEESGIQETVKSCFASDYPRSLFDVMVIADNCDDQTAMAAAEAGADVLERFDDQNKSKGFAIEYLIEMLSPSGLLETRHALVIIDADTTIDPGLLRAFDRGLRRGLDWIQCYYTVRDPDRSWRTRLMTYAFSLFNGVAPLGLCALGSSAGFRGNGMCFSTRGMRRRPWKSYGLVEDMEYSWSLRTAGEHIAFERGATVAAAMPSAGGKAASSQRARWEFGRGQIRRRFAPLVWRSAHMTPWDKLLSLIELLIPTMAVCAGLYLITAAANLGWVAMGESGGWAAWLLVGSTGLMTAALALYAISPFLALRLPWKYAGSLAFFPMYMVWKLVVGRKGPPTRWVRTEREPAGRAEPSPDPSAVSGGR